jgi:hypothetical protein
VLVLQIFLQTRLGPLLFSKVSFFTIPRGIAAILNSIFNFCAGILYWATPRGLKPDKTHLLVYYYYYHIAPFGGIKTLGRQ